MRRKQGNAALPNSGAQAALAAAVQADRQRPPSTAPLADQVMWLTQRAATPGTDQLELLTIYSEINETARRQKALVDGALSELADTLRLISLK